MDPKTQPADGEDAAENSSAAAEAIARDFDESIHLESPHSIGVDIVEIERMRAILERTPRFKTRIFSEDEQTYCNKKARPECHYATRFAAKEAVLKALGTGFSEGIGPRDVEVVITAKGKPQVKLIAALKRRLPSWASRTSRSRFPIRRTMRWPVRLRS